MHGERESEGERGVVSRARRQREGSTPLNVWPARLERGDDVEREKRMSRSKVSYICQLLHAD